jgi:hypothetical protein
VDVFEPVVEVRNPDPFVAAVGAEVVDVDEDAGHP